MKLADRIERAKAEAINKLPLAPKVKGIEFEPYTDSTGEPALRVIVVLAEDTSEKHRDFRKLSPIEQVIREALQTEEIDLWPYFWFRKPSEQ